MRRRGEREGQDRRRNARQFVSSVPLPEDFQSSRRGRGWRASIAAGSTLSPSGLSRGCQPPAASGCFAASQGQRQSLGEGFAFPRAMQNAPLALQIELGGVMFPHPPRLHCQSTARINKDGCLTPRAGRSCTASSQILCWVYGGRRGGQGMRIKERLSKAWESI